MPTRLLIIGLDGATFDVLEPLAGQLPNLARLMREGARGELLSTLPPATLPAWSSFLTGTTPGMHGVTDIFVRRGYDLVPASGALRGVPTFLEELSRRGLRVASLGVPGTYPPLALNGLCVAGFDAPGVHRATRASVAPASAWAEIEALGGYRYATFNEHREGERRLSVAADALCADIARKEELLAALLGRESWDVFFTHLQASDTSAHHLWHTFDPGSPRALGAPTDDLPRVFRALDKLIGRLRKGATRVLLVSDHGMGGASTTAVHINRVLADAGLLTFASEARAKALARRAVTRLIGELSPRLLGTVVRALPERVRARTQKALRSSPIDWAHTLAFSDELDYAPSVWIHRAGVFGSGPVQERDVKRVRARVKEALLATGLITAVHEREATPMQGPYLDRAPDLIIEPAWPNGYRPSFLRSSGPGPAVRDMRRGEFSAAKGAGLPGVHRAEGVLIMHGEGIEARKLPPTRIEEAGALVYQLLGERPPEHTVPAPRWDDPYSAKERRAVESRLRSLGYID
jgi:predicted AlkP superfamily phosphohydrolase/phosphomutase